MLHGDRGKPVWKKSVNLKDPNQFKLPALNFQIDEISCAIGILNLKKLNYLIYKRRKILKILKKRVNSETKLCRINYKIEGSSPSLFQIYLMKKIQKLRKSLHLNWLNLEFNLIQVTNTLFKIGIFQKNIWQTNTPVTMQKILLKNLSI